MIVGITGKIGHGKDTVGQMLGDTSTQLWYIKKFAYKLKKIASILTGIPEEKFEDQEFKKEDLGREWWTKEYDSHNGFDIERSYGMTAREFLQRLGTDGLRNHLHPNTWVNALFADYKAATKMAIYSQNPRSAGVLIEEREIPPTYPNWIITDVRFPNEAQAIKEREGLIIRVVRNSVAADKVNLHPSETALDDYKVDQIITNDGTLEELLVKVKEFMIANNIT